MRVIGILSFFDESPAWLSQCVASLKRACDHLVACDGLYALYPGALTRPARSPLEQRIAIMEAAEAVDLPLTLYTPGAPFLGNEVEKRNLTLDLARAVSTPWEDWFLVVDSDEIVSHVGDFFRHDLETAEEHVATYALWDGMDPSTVEGNGRWSTPVRALYRNIPGLRYERRHYLLVAPIDGRDVYLWGHPELGHEQLDAKDLTSVLHVEHRKRFRNKERNSSAATYCELRDRYGVEPLMDRVMEGVDGQLVSIV